MVISKTPLRISFVGGGTDMKNFYSEHKGQVLSAAIDKYIYVIVKARVDDLIVLHYTENEVVSNVDEIQHELIRECLKLAGITKSIEIITMADITSKGSGLGSSSVLTVGLLNALYTYAGKQVTNEQLAQEACHIEICKLNKPIGKQDQYIAAYGGIKKFIFNKDETVDFKKIELSESDKKYLSSNVLLHNTSITRKADAILQDQTNNVSSRIAELMELSGMVDDLEAAFSVKDFEKLGYLLKQNWEKKKQLAKGISFPEIDEMVMTALSNGALGGKIAGAGGGGFLMSYVPKENQDKFRQAMARYAELQYAFDHLGTRIILNIA